MRKKTAWHTPDSPKASPNQPSGLIAKGQQPGESVQEECVLDNRSHRTIALIERSGPPNRPVDHVQVTRNGCYRQRLIHGTPLVGRLRRGSPEAARAGGPVLYDVTLLNLSQVVSRILRPFKTSCCMSKGVSCWGEKRLP